MNEVGVTRQFKDLTGGLRALERLFSVVGDEERKIRTNPTARVTDTLEDVFGR